MIRSRDELPQTVAVFAATDFRAVDGANLGDPLSIADDLILGDTYRLTAGAEETRLSLVHGVERDGLFVAPASATGRPGAALHLDCLATFLSADGSAVEILVAVELDEDGRAIERLHVFALAPLRRRRDYTLVAVSRRAARTRFAEASCVSFTHGTRITLPSGRQQPVEELRPGVRVLTRDHGPQPIRWIGHRTARAVGAFAPIRIARGVLNNDEDLLVSPNHRLFVYQRRDRVRAGRAEILVQARHLVDDIAVTRTDGGFVDYYQLLFDRHEIVYAAGIAVETLLVDTRTRSALPASVAVHPSARDAREIAIDGGEGRITASDLRLASSG